MNRAIEVMANVHPARLAPVVVVGVLGVDIEVPPQRAIE